MCRRPSAFGGITSAVLLLGAMVFGAALVGGGGTVQAREATVRGGTIDAPRYGFGRAPTAAELAAWDIDVRPDGHGVRRGKGTVAAGEKIYQAQCASCHGTFGESNSYMVIGGGVTRGDIERGRAAGLRDPNVVRTVGNKLAHATTLWDYIYRAMPWNAPQSLSVDEVYAVTAYVLRLNEIVPEDFELNDRNLLTLRLPNRNGFTRDHGMLSAAGRPDVQGSRCMQACRDEVRIVSTLPNYARNAHGNLAEQKRPIGPTRGVDTTRFETAATQREAAPVAASAESDARTVLARNACTTCHGIDHRLVGPGFQEVASRYGGASGVDAAARLANRIKQGGVGTWGDVPMPAQPHVKDDDVQLMVNWILGGAR